MTQENPTGETKANRRALLVRGVIRLIMVFLFIAVPLFAGAGTLNWTRGWMFIALLGISFASNLLMLITKRPALLKERWKRRADTKRFDKIFGIAYLFFTILMLTLAGVDSVRFSWTTVPWYMVYVGLGLHILGTIPMVWSMLSNKHLETTVRIQKDRDHKVITTGPYAYVRHPMYVGIILMFFGWALVLGSWVAVAMAGLITILFIIRTKLEDQTLQNELEGYTEFCRKTRYRLLPGVW